MSGPWPISSGAAPSGGRRGALIALLAAALFTGAPASALAEAPYRLGKEGSETPRRVITLAPSITEIVLDLGMGDRLVGVSRYDDADEVKSLARVGGFLDPSPEAILRLEPDLLLVQPSPGNRATVMRLASLGVPILVLPLQSIQEVHDSVVAVGEALGSTAEGKALAAKIRQGLEEVRRAAANRPPTSVLIVYTWSPLVVAGPGSFADELLGIVGARNVAGGLASPYPTLPGETALAYDPAVVVDASGGHGGSGASFTDWEGRVRKPASNALFRPGPRVVQGARDLSALLAPAPAPAPKAEEPTP